MRGQAFVVFEEQSAATAAMRALVGEEFYGRPLVSAHCRLFRWCRLCGRGSSTMLQCCGEMLWGDCCGTEVSRFANACRGSLAADSCSHVATVSRKVAYTGDMFRAVIIAEVAWQSVWNGAVCVVGTLRP